MEKDKNNYPFEEFTKKELINFPRTDEQKIPNSIFYEKMHWEKYGIVRHNFACISPWKDWLDRYESFMQQYQPSPNTISISWYPNSWLVSEKRDARKLWFHLKKLHSGQHIENFDICLKIFVCPKHDCSSCQRKVTLPLRPRTNQLPAHLYFLNYFFKGYMRSILHEKNPTGMTTTG